MAEEWQIVAAVIAGLALATISLWARTKSGGKVDLRAVDLAVVLGPILVWMLVTGRIEKLNLFGMEVEVKKAILGASTESIENQVTLKDVDLMEADEKRALAEIPDLKRRGIEALEFRLGSGRYVDSVVQQYFEQLTTDGDLKWVVLYDVDETGKPRVFAVLDVLLLLRSFGTMSFADSYSRFAEAVNANDDDARAHIGSLPGFVPGELAVTTETPKAEALSRMDDRDLDRLPVVNAQGAFLGMIERERLTASLILDVTQRLSE